jgi:hypothetical protein
MKCCPHNTNGTDIPFRSTKPNIWIKNPIIGLLSQLKRLIIGRRPYGLTGNSGEDYVNH